MLGQAFLVSSAADASPRPGLKMQEGADAPVNLEGPCEQSGKRDSSWAPDCCWDEMNWALFGGSLSPLWRKFAQHESRTASFRSNMSQESQRGAYWRIGVPIIHSLRDSKQLLRDSWSKCFVGLMVS